jgi:hypothetical protein
VREERSGVPTRRLSTIRFMVGFLDSPIDEVISSISKDQERPRV